jgi:hypothetical protein
MRNKTLRSPVFIIIIIIFLPHMRGEPPPGQEAPVATLAFIRPWLTSRCLIKRIQEAIVATT